MSLSNLYFDLEVDYATREIAVSGEFDFATAPCLTRAIAGFQHAGPGAITVVLDRVSFVDSAGIAAVAAANRAQAKRGECLGVTGATTKVRAVFRIGGLTELLHAC